MAGLNVQAVVSNHVAQAGTTDAVPITVSVTHANGVPLSTLTQADFTVGDTWAPSRVEVALFEGGVLQIGLGAVNAGGLYMLSIVPIAGATWVAGSVYHIVIVVAAGGNHGQTIAELYIPTP
jgi:hypothetical protein